MPDCRHAFIVDYDFQKSETPKNYDEHCWLENMALRALLDGRASRAFPLGGVADVAIDFDRVHERLADMHRALVAHDALLVLLVRVGSPTPSSLLDAILFAEDLQLISRTEARWLKYYNRAANRAKHESFPF